MENSKIKKIIARQILDSRGNPTIETTVLLNSGHIGRASVPSGASTGTGEAVELRDNDSKFYNGKSVHRAIWNVNHTINDVLIGNSADQEMTDQLMIVIDGTKNKASLGANAILSVSLATAKAVANAKQLPFYKYIAELAQTQDQMSLPMPMMNIMNGGEHANWSTDFQEYMIIPRGAYTIQEAVQIGAEVFHALGNILKTHGYATTVGDEGGYAPKVKHGNIEPLECIKMAVEKVGYKMGKDVAIAMDIAASEFAKDGKYMLKTDGTSKTADEMINWYERIITSYPVVSIEDGLSEDDWTGWQKLTQRLGDRIQLVGDDLFVTNAKLLQKGIDEKVANAILIKPNQIGTLTETIKAVMLAKQAGYNTIISHRSGETEDTSIAHIAVGLGAGQIKTGSLSRSERICKYNELMRIAETNSNLHLTNQK